MRSQTERPRATRAASEPSIEIGATARLLLEAAIELAAQSRSILDGHNDSRTDVERAFGTLRAEMVGRELAKIPAARLKETTGGGLRLSSLEAAGYRTVFDVVNSSPRVLQQVEGVGPMTANQAYAAARQVAAAVEDGLKVRIDLDPSDSRSSDVLVALRRFDVVDRSIQPVRSHAQQLAIELGPLIAAARPARHKVRYFFMNGKRKSQATAALARLHRLVVSDDTEVARKRLDDATDALGQPAASRHDTWKDFEKRAAEYYGVLGEIVDLRLDIAAAEGYMPADIVARINDQRLDDTFRRVSLRGYQSFGARFALVQRRVIIGDEMGLGKTIEAIAAIAHLRALGATHFLVVCPASVLVNWTREVGARSTLRAYRVHGLEASANLKAWLARGDIAITTYDSLRNMTLPDDTKLAMLVVDEAHYVKNPAAQRSMVMTRWVARAERVVFLTGTPMENKVEEFKNLVAYLQPQLATAVSKSAAVAGAAAFRKAVAPAYLRRNQEDVLTELPALVHVDEWTEFGSADFSAYRQAVLDGNFMAMRRAAFADGVPAHSAKLQRLLEIADEATENGHKVVVFSFFRDVLQKVHTAVGRHAFGPLTGDVTPVKRQALVDAFSNEGRGGVLIAQIQAGGVGLNIQAASIVVLCEPQVKPTLEAQAVARVHRMGQVRSVQVHRLLVADSVDQRMLEILSAKARLFDEYARRSAIAEASPDAVDISEVDLARQVVAAEQERLGRLAMAAALPSIGTQGTAPADEYLNSDRSDAT